MALSTSERCYLPVLYSAVDYTSFKAFLSTSNGVWLNLFTKYWRTLSHCWLIRTRMCATAWEGKDFVLDCVRC